MSHKLAKLARRRMRERQRTLEETKVERLLVRTLEYLQKEFAKRAKGQYERFPNMRRPCHTCALNPSTNDWSGQATTALNFMHALWKTQPFLCHDGVPFDEETGWHVTEQAPLCSGYAVLLTPDLDINQLLGAALSQATVDVYGDGYRKLDFAQGGVEYLSWFMEAATEMGMLGATQVEGRLVSDPI